jgi:Ser/Thr protein kinase RdoA (MazF antagonist)
MYMATSSPVPVIYATATMEAVASFAAAQYGLSGRLECTFLNRGFNDIYRLQTEAGERFVLRLSTSRARGPADVAAETAFLADLEGAGLPVASALPALDGQLFSVATLPEGPRPAVLFHHLDGRRPDLDAPGDAWIQGVTLARIHDQADRYPGRETGRYRLDLDHLLHRPVAAMLARNPEPSRARDDLLALRDRLTAAVERLDLTLTRCYGDCHGANARIATAGLHAGQAVFFDFDDGGFGYLAYDLAVHLWAQVSFGRTRQAMWHAFRQGYESIRRLAPADEAAIPMFVAIRHLWLVGSWAAQLPYWGTEAMWPDWFARELKFLLGWERDQLSPRLL